MKFSFIKLAIVSAICLISGYGAGVVSNIAAQQAAQEVFNRQGYDDRDVRFEIPQLQQYSTEVAVVAARRSGDLQAAIFGCAVLMSGLALSYPGSRAQSRSENLFSRWTKAVRSNNSSEMAAIEIEAQKIEEPQSDHSYN